MKDDGSLNMNEGKSSRRGGVSGHGAHEVCTVCAKATAALFSLLLHFVFE